MWDDISGWFTDHGISILIILSLAYLARRALKIAIRPTVCRYVKAKAKKRHSQIWYDKRSDTLTSLITTISSIFISLVALGMILPELGIDIGPLMAGAGVAGIAIGFGAQNLIKDYVSGFFILIEDQFNKGDVVKIAGISGFVEDIGIRRTILRDLDGINHSIPNGEITISSNYTRGFARINLDISVGYNEDLDHVMAVINKVGNELAEDKKYKELINKAPQALRVNNFGDSGIDIKILGEVRPSKQWEITGELRRRLKIAFDQENIEIPWPHVKLYFGENPEGKLPRSK